jgi:hypothetical protein
MKLLIMQWKITRSPMDVEMKLRNPQNGHQFTKFESVRLPSMERACTLAVKTPKLTVFIPRIFAATKN